MINIVKINIIGKSQNFDISLSHLCSGTCHFY